MSTIFIRLTGKASDRKQRRLDWERVAMQHYDRLADRIDEALDKACETLVSQGFEQAENIKERILFARKEVK